MAILNYAALHGMKFLPMPLGLWIDGERPVLEIELQNLPKTGDYASFVLVGDVSLRGKRIDNIGKLQDTFSLSTTEQYYSRDAFFGQLERKIENIERSAVNQLEAFVAEIKHQSAVDRSKKQSKHPLVDILEDL